MTEKKSASIFDFVDGVTSKKKEWSGWSETDRKLYSPYIVNRWLSMRQDLTEIVNELQCYTIGLLRPQETYRLYHDLLPTNKSFAKYIKGKKDDDIIEYNPSTTVKYDLTKDGYKLDFKPLTMRLIKKKIGKETYIYATTLLNMEIFPTSDQRI
jgi:hypothetical protein